MNRPEVEDMLAQGEHVLWRGRPDAKPYVTLAQIGRMLRVLIAVLLLLYILARLGYGLPPMTDIRVIVLIIVFQAVPLEIVKSAVLRRWSSYVLTDRRAFVVLDMPVTGRVVRAFPILPETPVEMRLGARFSSFFFGMNKRRFWDRRGYLGETGFERIREGAAVAALIGQIQRGQA